MIARVASLANAAAPAAIWQRTLGDAVSSVGELLELLGLESRQLPPWSLSHVQPAETAARDFPLRVPRGFVARMRRGDPVDPLLLQVLPTAAELVATPGFSGDPLAESDDAAAFSPLPGVLHKYRGRALLLVTGACGVHCRYCFRRHFPYAEHTPRGDGWGSALAWLAGNPAVEEVILSGGDPLAVGDEKLARLVAELDAIPHLRRLRVHTRMPVVLPERVDAALLGWLGAHPPLAGGGAARQPRPRSSTPRWRRRSARLRAAGVTVLNQAVLLAGVNDSVAAQCELSRALFAAGALPYYLHLLDRVAGAAHFEVPEARARELLRDVMAELPGYLVPRLVREVPGAPYKVPLDLDAG